MFRVLTPAADRGLLTIPELRAAAGVQDDAQDAHLQSLGLRVADLMARAAGIAVDGVLPPTFRLEVAEETFQCSRGAKLLLARRFVHDVSSVTEAGRVLPVSDYALDGGAGVLTRLDGDRRRGWSGLVTVSYASGFDLVPEDLKHLAAVALREILSAENRDPLLRSETLDGVGRWDWQVGGSARGAGGALPVVVADGLWPYRSVELA